MCLYILIGYSDHSIKMKVIFVIFFSLAIASTILPEDVLISNSILIQGGTVVNAHLSELSDVLIQDGKIVRVGKNLAIPKGSRVIDATGKFVMPGGIGKMYRF